MRRLLALLCLAALPAAAQEATEVQSDLNGDGTAETFAVSWDDSGETRLTVDGRTYTDVVWSGAMMGNTPYLEVAPNGSVRVISQNMAIGRDRWVQALTVAYRDGDYRVAGFTYDWYDTLDPDANGGCDLNLLTGRGTATVRGETRDVAASVGALPLAEWKMETFPDECLP